MIWAVVGTSEIQTGHWLQRWDVDANGIQIVGTLSGYELQRWGTNWTLAVEMGYCLDMGCKDILLTGHWLQSQVLFAHGLYTDGVQTEHRLGTYWMWTGEIGYCLDIGSRDGILTGHRQQMVYRIELGSREIELFYFLSKVLQFRGKVVFLHPLDNFLQFKHELTALTLICIYLQGNVNSWSVM